MTKQSEGKGVENAVRVCVRVRTMSEKEKDCGYRNCVAFDDPTNQVVLQAPANHNFHRHHGKPFHGFAFDHFYGPKESSEDIYRDCVAKLVENATRGFNACVLAYGQTGSGKTYTMTGGTGNCGMKDKGIIPQAIEQLFALLEATAAEKLAAEEDYSFKVSASAMEVYNEELKDLGPSVQGSQQEQAASPEPNKRPMSARGQGPSRGQQAKLELRDNRNKQTGFSTEVVGLSEQEFTCSKELLRFFKMAGRHRTTTATMMNDTSSRSHAIFTVTIHQSSSKYVDKDGNAVAASVAKQGTWWRGSGGSTHSSSSMSRLNLVDLAGSERVKKSGVGGKELKEASSINSGLLVLGNVICALADRAEGKSTHIPYRDVKLTRILQDSLGGNSLTTLISCISPSDSDFDESFNTLQYANRACKIKNVALSNTWNQVVEESLPMPAATSMMSLLDHLDSTAPRKRGLRRRDESNIEEQLIEVPMESEEKGFTEDFKGRKRAAIARRNRAAQYDMLRRKAMGGYGSKVKDFKGNKTITGVDVHRTRERPGSMAEVLSVTTPGRRVTMPVMGMSPSPGLKQRGSGAGDSMAASSSGSGSRSKPAPGMSAGAIGKEMSFAQWMAQMEAEEQAAAAHESAIAEETSEQIRSHEEVVECVAEVEACELNEKGGVREGEIEIKVDAGKPVPDGSVDESYLDGESCDDELEDEEGGLEMADELEEHAQHFKEHLVFQKPSSARVTAEEVGVPPKEGPPPTLPACGVKQEIQGLPGGEAGTSGCENFLGGAGDVSMDSQEEDAEVLVRFRVNQHIAVTVHKACTKDDFEEVVALLPHNTPLPSSDRMIYLLARVIEDMETGEVGRAVGCLMASIGTCMISSCIYAFDDPHEVEQFTTEERVELWGLQIPQPSAQLQGMMAAGGEVPLKEWSSVDRLTMSIGLLFGLCCYADDNEIRAGFCVPRPQLLDRWMSAGVPMHGLGGQMQLIYPAHAHDYQYYRSSTVAYFLVDEVIETLGFILAFL